jgi:hypothetical protein
MEEFIVYGHVLDKNLLWVCQIRLQLAETAPAKSRLKQENPETSKKGMKDGTCEKYERWFCSLSCAEQKPLSFF